MGNSKKLQVRIDEYAYGVWFDTVDIDPYSQTVRIYDHLFDKEQTFSDSKNKVVYREVEVNGMKNDKKWLEDEVSELYPSYDEMYVSPDYETVAKAETISKVLELVNQLDEPETLSQDWIDENRITAINNLRKMTTSEVVPVEKLENLLVPKQDDGFVVFEKDKLDEEVQRMIDETYESMNEKPVIPNYVAKWVEEVKKQNKSLVFAITHIYDQNEIGKSPNKEEKRIFQWMELADNEEVFARAWLDGYEVEKEKLYHVVNKENYFMLRKYDGLVELHTSPSMSRDKHGKDTRFMLSEQEIKDYDERFWVFAEGVTE